MKRRHSYDRDIVILLVFTLITLSTWVGFEVYRALNRNNIPDVLAKYLRPLNPSLNVPVLSALQERLP